MNRYYTPAPAGCGRMVSASCGCNRNGSGGTMGGCWNETAPAPASMNGTVDTVMNGTGTMGTAGTMTERGAVNFETVTTGPARDALLEMLPLAMAYVPLQRWGATYSAQQALQQGTLFPELDLPFEGRRRAWK